jgi:uncharacterized membrane protein
MNNLYRFAGSLMLLVAIPMLLLTIRIVFSDSLRFSFMFWNLFLAFVPVLLAWWLVDRVRRFGWQKWQQALLSLAWITFLPNSFYLITDLIHLRPNYEADFLFDITLLMSFILPGVMFGFMSVYIVHSEIVKRASEKLAFWLIGLLFLASSFAICLGRYTRWNTWDILLQPAGLLFDVSDRLIYPTNHLQTYQTTLTMFMVLFSVYLVVWESGRLIRRA